MPPKFPVLVPVELVVGEDAFGIPDVPPLPEKLVPALPTLFGVPPVVPPVMVEFTPWAQTGELQSKRRERIRVGEFKKYLGFAIDKAMRCKGCALKGKEFV
jgi:hypothetical protein